MRGFIFLLCSTALLAQAPLTTTQAAKPASKSTTATSATATKSTTAAKPATATAKKPATPMTEDQKAVYTLGLSISKSLSSLELTADEMKLVTQAMEDSAAGKPAVKLEEYGPKMQAFGKAREAKIAERRKAESAVFLTKAAAEPGVQKTSTGLIYKELRAGTGASPKATDNVKVNYRGTLTDGKEFDSSYSRNQPAEFPLGGVIPCWTEGLQKMKVGGKAQLVCPSSIAYGDQGRPGAIPGGATLLFEVELLDIKGPTQTPPPPPPPAASTPK